MKLLTPTFTLAITLLFAPPQAVAQDNDTTDVVRNIVSFFPTKATKINGFCFALSHNKPRTINGLNIEFPGARFTEYFIFMMSRDIVPERFSTVNGLTITFNPIYRKINGVGIFAFMPEVYEFNGLAIGSFNAVKEMHGVQLGVFNNARDGRFIQLGFINTIYSNPKPFRVLPVFNCRFRKKEKDSDPLQESTSR